MRQTKRLIKKAFLLCLFASLMVCANAQIIGRVVDSRNKQALDYVNVYYEGKNVGTLTDDNGRFIIKQDSNWHELTISAMGYVSQTIDLSKAKKSDKELLVKLVPEPKHLETITITGKKTKYSRKDNPAVALMRNVIAHKKSNSLYSKEFFSYTKYDKMTFSINEFRESIFEEEEGKTWAFLKEHVEYCKATGKLILPLTIDETLSDIYYRSEPKTEKTLIKAKNARGVNDLINTGDILTTILQDCFTDINIYDEECRLMQLHFKSPIANSAIGFYRYYINDTIVIENDSVIDVGFVANNMQDVAFTGHLYVLKDSSYQVRRCELSVPKRSDINFVESMTITQDFEELETGDRVVTSNDMLIELLFNSWMKKLQVQRVTRSFDYSFAPISKSVFKSIKGNVFTEPDATMHTDDAYWNEYRKVELTGSESKMGDFLTKLTQIKGFKYIMIGMKALIENFVETADSVQHNKFDVGPINTTISYNDYDKYRFRLSGLTTANLHPHVFGNGYIAYSPHTDNVYYRGELIYSFNKKAYLTREFPVNNLHVSYMNDVVTPFDKFMPTDKDNVFTAFKTTHVDQYNHSRELKIFYERELYNGAKFSFGFTRTKNKAVDELFYQRLGTDNDVSASLDMKQLAYDPSLWESHITTSEIKASASFEPGATYINTKQRRIKINKDAPIISLSHTMGIKGLFGGEYNYNVTELGFYKRLYVPAGWGYLSTNLKAGIQWNKVPFPLLIHPAANQSFIIEEDMFLLISNYEFLNDRYAQAMIEWDMCGKIFNRVPLLKKLKWREMIGINVLWGSLSNKNNPAYSGYEDSELMYLPGHWAQDSEGNIYYENNTIVMDPNIPYAELRLGIHNIFKLFHVEYVKRLSYKDNPNTNKQGIRFLFRVFF